MRFALISDIHSNIAALDAVLDDIAGQSVDRIVNLGDSLSGPFAPRETAERLMALGLPTVSGNHDRMLVDRPASEMGAWETWAIAELDETHLDWVRGLPRTIAEDDVLFCHATPGDDAENWLDHRGPEHRLVARDTGGVRMRLGDTDAAVVACGHTHSPRIVRLPEGPMIVNAGSVGCPAYRDTRMEPNFIHQTGAPDARYAIVERTDGVWSAMLLSVPYDSSGMARLAREKGAESWAEAVETGWLV